MKRSIFDQNARDEIISRIKKLDVDSKGRWGILSSTQMIHHLYESCKMAFDEIPMPDRSNILTKTLGKWMFLSNIKLPGREKGKIKTVPEVDVVSSNMKTDEIESEKEKYFTILERMISTNELSKKHTLFGKMKREDWGYLTYAHADYHLTQFNM